MKGTRAGFLSLLLALTAGCSTYLMKQTEVERDEPEVAAKVSTPQEKEGPPAPGPEEGGGQDEHPEDVMLSPDGKTCTKFYRIRHISTDDLLRLVNLRFYSADTKPPSKPGAPPQEHQKVQAHHVLNMLIITDTVETIREISDFLDEVDRITTQLEIKIRVVEVSRTYQFEYGFDFFLDRAPASQSALRSVAASYDNRSFLDSLLTSSPFQGTSLEFASVGSVVTDIGDLSVVLRGLEEKGLAKIIAEPSIKIHNGETAEINAIRKEPIPQLEQMNPTTTRITTRYEDVGVKLKVTVKNIGQNAALLEVNPEVSTVQSFTDPQTFGGLTVPKIATRNARTVLDVKDGDVFTIGGLKDTRILVEHRQVPILGSIPLIGILFKSRREREEQIELLFILEIHILGEEKKTTLYDPGK